MTSTRAVSPAAGWTHKLDLEGKQEHEFSNLLQEFLYAVQRQDGMLMEYCACELKRMFRAQTTEKRSATELKPSQRLLDGTCFRGWVVGCDSRSDSVPQNVADWVPDFGVG
jgi:hypothetical protein